MAPYYYHDPSGLGVWYVQDGQTPQQAFDALNIIPDPILSYSVENTPAAKQINGGNPNAPANKPAPGPKGYTVTGSTITPNLPALTDTQKKGLFKPRDIINADDPGASLNDCGPDAYLQVIDGVYTCVPINIIPFPGGQTQGGTGTISSQSTYVTVNNTLDLASGVGQAIGDAVTSSVQSDLNTVNNAIDDTTNTIQATLKDVTSGIGSLVDGIIQNVYKALQWLGNLLINNIQKVAGFISDNIGKIASAVADIASKITDVVQNVIGPAVLKINDVVSNTIAPIFNTISDVFRQTQALITAIQQDVKNGLQGVLHLPQDIANGLTGIVGDITNAVTQIGLKKKDGTSVFIGPDGNDSIWNRLSGIGSNLGAPQGPSKLATTFADKVSLANPSLTQIGAEALETLHKLGMEALAMEGKYHDDVNATLRSSYADVGGILGSLATLGVDWFLVAATLAASLLPLYRAVGNQADYNIPINKLSPAEAINSYVRTLITKEQAQTELQFAGYDATRQQALLDLSKWLAPMNDAIEWWFRGIIDDKDLSQNLTEHGVIADDQQAIKEGSLKRVAVEITRTALRWGIIDNEAFDAVLKQNRYTDNEIALEHATLLQQETVQDVIERERLTILYSGLGFSPEGFATPSTDVLQAATRDGIDARAALDRWQASFFIFPLNEWIVGYFRGVLTLRQLNAAMDYYRVPDGLRDILVSTHRALIPWRTIPTMLANGIIDESYAKQQLQAHGFDLVATEALIKYADIAHKKSKAAASPDVLGLSVATARGYFDQGAITSEQYQEILLAHGYDKQSASLAVQVETQHAVMLARKRLAADIVDEAVTGLITVDQAMGQMDSNQFSPVEKSRALNAIHRALKQSSKIPGEGDLHSMAKAGAISLDLYRQGLAANGYAQSWIQAFVNWRFPSAATS